MEIEVHPSLMDAKCPDCHRNMVAVADWQLECLHDDCDNSTKYRWPTMALEPVEDGA